MHTTKIQLHGESDTPQQCAYDASERRSTGGDADQPARRFPRLASPSQPTSTTYPLVAKWAPKKCPLPKHSDCPSPPNTNRMVQRPRPDLRGGYAAIRIPTATAARAGQPASLPRHKAFGCAQGNLDCEYSRRIVFFIWQGFDEMDKVNGDGSAELDEDGVIEIEIRFHLGDEAILKALR